MELRKLLHSVILVTLLSTTVSQAQQNSYFCFGSVGAGSASLLIEDSRLLDSVGYCENKVEHLCEEELRAHYCYLEHNRNLCCRTCQTLRRADPECPYGDHYTRIVRKGADGQNKTYTCEAYVKFYGKHHCLVDEKFRQYCCESCKGA